MAPTNQDPANISKSLDGILASSMQRRQHQTRPDVPQQNVSSRSITINVDDNGRIVDDYSAYLASQVDFADAVSRSRMPSPVQEETSLASTGSISSTSVVDLPFDVTATFQAVNTPSNLNSVTACAKQMKWPQNLTTPTHCQYVARSLTLPVDNDGYILQDPLDIMESAQDILNSGKKVPSPVVDPSVLFGMERTLFSAWNIGMLIQIFGSGLWMAHPDDETLHFLGALLIFVGILFIAGSYCLHLWRIQRLKSGKSAPAYSSEAWTGILCFILTSALVMELVYAVVYPYLLRSVPVTIAEAT